MGEGEQRDEPEDGAGDGSGPRERANDDFSLAATHDGSARLDLSEAATMDAPPSDTPITYSRSPTDPAPAPKMSLAAPGASRYRVLEELGRGGMGMVQLAEDDRLGRRVAIKSRLGGHQSERTKLRFVEEARATAQLEHPNIVPVYDIDEDELGRPRFSMRVVEGDSLSSVIERLRAGDASANEKFPAAERILVMLKVCDAVAYAHSRGVLHRDLKPENIMLGRFGEVFVMDWGLARVSEAIGGDDVSSISSVRDSGARLTVDGSIVGTPGYMAPEQARGETKSIDGQSDVWALGAVLYELLTLSPAVEGQNIAALLANSILGNIETPSAKAPNAGITPGMDLVLMRALAVSRDARYESVVAFRDAVSHELEGSREAERRRISAETKHAAARGHLMRHADLNEVHSRQQELAEEGLSSLPTDVEHLDERRELFKQQAEADHTGADARRAFWDAYGSLVGAVEDDPKFEPARESLVRLLLGRASEAKNRGDQQTARDFEAIARQHDPVRVAGLLDAPATVEVVTRPAGAHVRISRFVEEGPLLVETPAGELKTTPATVELSPGSYVLDIQHPERPPIRATVLVGPGERVQRDVWIPGEGVVADGFCYVPGGEYWIGGDELAPNFEPRRRVKLKSFALQKHPVTLGEYREFLNHLRDSRGAEGAAMFAPRVAGATYWKPTTNGYELPFIDPDGDEWQSELPVIMMSATSATAYAEWRSQLTATRVRLPTSDEWEVAAGGGDGRIFPWGNGFDVSCCWMVKSFNGRPSQVPVGTKPLDTSVYGVADMAGLVRDWTSTVSPPDLQVVRGGAWQASANQCRIGRRTPLRAEDNYPTLSIRVAQSVGPT